MGKISKIFTTDLLIIGSGVAGLAASIEGLKTQEVFLVSKSKSSTALAQGGIAAALDKSDSPKKHYQDTLYAGAGLCQKKAVTTLVREGITAVQDLIKYGMQFEQNEKGLVFGREAAHSANRIVHTGDTIGQELLRILKKQVLTLTVKKFTNREHCSTLKLLVENNNCSGAQFIDHQTGTQFAVLAKNIILATGGYIQIYKHNTNPAEITGDGIALAYRAGAVIQDMEFVQFHPTTLYTGIDTAESFFLISEAVRGEGAILRNIMRYRFMQDYHPLAELAPRDIVTRAIIQEMQKTNSSHVLLDLSQVKNPQERFPAIYRKCEDAGINITKDLVPVVPAAHYAIGGVAADLNSRTSIKHLYACGETAASGLHGANRLASNSLLEGLVFGRRAARACSENLQHLPQNPSLAELPVNLNINKTNRLEIKNIMWQNVGIIRDKQNLEIALKRLAKINPADNDFETNNLLTCALLVTQAALQRKESRGTHYRTDYPHRNIFWKRHLKQIS